MSEAVATDDPATLRVLRGVSPGMLQRPTAAITICTDRALAAGYAFPPNAPGLFIDVGTAMATLQLAAHALRRRSRAGDLLQPRRGRRRPATARGLEAGTDRLPRSPGAGRGATDARAGRPDLARPHHLGQGTAVPLTMHEVVGPEARTSTGTATW